MGARGGAAGGGSTVVEKKKTSRKSVELGEGGAKKSKRRRLTEDEKARNKEARRIRDAEKRRAKRSAYEAKVISEIRGLVGDPLEFLSDSLAPTVTDRRLVVMLGGEKVVETFIHLCLADTSSGQLRGFLLCYIDKYIEWVGQHAVSSQAKVRTPHT